MKDLESKIARFLWCTSSHWVLNVCPFKYCFSVCQLFSITFNIELMPSLKFDELGRALKAVSRSNMSSFRPFKVLLLCTSGYCVSRDFVCVTLI